MFPLWGHFGWISALSTEGTICKLFKLKLGSLKPIWIQCLLTLAHVSLRLECFWAFSKDREESDCVDSYRPTIWMPFRWGISWAVCLCFSYYLKFNNRHCRHSVLSVLYAAFVKFSFSFFVLTCCQVLQICKHPCIIQAPYIEAPYI